MGSHRTKSLRRTAVIGTVALASAGLVGMVGPASAADLNKPGPTVEQSTSSPVRPGGRIGKNGVCEVSELCLYFFQDRGGAFLDLFNSDPDFSDDVLRGGGTGNLSNANNNTRSILSRESSVYWRVYNEVNYTGNLILCAAPGDRANFYPPLYDTPSSARWSSTPC
jgi:hypothetical protein